MRNDLILAVMFSFFSLLLPLTGSAPVCDDFNRADGPPGAEWTVITGSWEIEGQEIVQTDTSSGSKRMTYDASTDVQYGFVSVDWEAMLSEAGDYLGVYRQGVNFGNQGFGCVFYRISSSWYLLAFDPSQGPTVPCTPQSGKMVRIRATIPSGQETVICEADVDEDGTWDDCTNTHTSTSSTVLSSFKWGLYAGDFANGDDFCFGDTTTAVTLALFDVEQDHDLLRVLWETASETSNAGFHIRRSESEDGPYERITDAMIPAEGGPTWGAEYSVEDSDVIPGVAYFYKLEDVDVNGAITLHGPVSGKVPEVWAVPGASTVQPGKTKASKMCNFLLLGIPVIALVLWRMRRQR